MHYESVGCWVSQIGSQGSCLAALPVDPVSNCVRWASVYGTSLNLAAWDRCIPASIPAEESTQDLSAT